jgi:hypothetical protein
VNERIKSLAIQAGLNVILEQHVREYGTGNWDDTPYPEMEKFAELIIRACVDKLETYRIPVGNSAAGELACEWTYDALLKIRDDIREHFGMGVEE